MWVVILGTICLLYTLIQHSVDVYDEDYEGSHKNVHKFRGHNFKKLKNKEIDHQNIVQDPKKDLRNLIPENHMENYQNSLDENRKPNQNEILANKQINKEFVYANATNTTNSNNNSV